jgi:hypothetical protein
MNEFSKIMSKLGIKGTPKPGEMISRMNAMKKQNPVMGKEEKVKINKSNK